MAEAGTGGVGRVPGRPVSRAAPSFSILLASQAATSRTTGWASPAYQAASVLTRTPGPADRPPPALST